MSTYRRGARRTWLPPVDRSQELHQYRIGRYEHHALGKEGMTHGRGSVMKTIVKIDDRDEIGRVDEDLAQSGFPRRAVRIVIEILGGVAREFLPLGSRNTPPDLNE